jgi:hypothetical protein
MWRYVNTGFDRQNHDLLSTGVTKRAQSLQEICLSLIVKLGMVANLLKILLPLPEFLASMSPSDSLLPNQTGYLFPVLAGTSFTDSRTSGPPKFLVVFGARCLLPARRVLLSVSASFFPGGSGFVL